MRFGGGVIVALLAIFAAADASACECPEKSDVAGELESAELVFFGRVSLHNEATLQYLETRFWEFEVQGVWKGPAQPVLRLYAHAPDGTPDRCDREFKVGESYLVFAHETKGHPGRFRAHVCSNTTRADGAMSVLRVLGRPTTSFR